MAEKLMLKCKTCGVEFDSPIQTNRKSLDEVELVKNTFTCPDGHTASYNRPDYHEA